MNKFQRLHDLECCLNCRSGRGTPRGASTGIALWARLSSKYKGHAQERKFFAGENVFNIFTALWYKGYIECCK